jgi:hypothetical protein
VFPLEVTPSFPSFLFLSAAGALFIACCLLPVGYFSEP